MTKPKPTHASRAVCAAGLAAALGLSLVAAGPAGLAAAAPEPRDIVGGFVPAGQSVQFIWRLSAASDTKAAARLEKVAKPGNSKFRKYKSASQLATKFGAPASTEATLTAGLAGTGITAAIDKSRLFARATATAANWQTAIGQPLVQITNTERPGAISILPEGELENVAPVLPNGLGATVDPIWESSTYAPPAVRDLPVEGNKAPFKEACKAAKKAAANVNKQNPIVPLPTKGSAFSPKEVAKAYGINKLQSAASNGKNAKVGIIALGSGFDNDYAKIAAKCLGWKNAKNKAVLTDGMAGQLLTGRNGGAEGDLDVQTLRAMLPNAGTIRIYEALSEAYWGLPYIKALNSKHRPDVLSTSYGLCEAAYLADAGSAARDLVNSAVLRLGLSGTSVLVASGDSGSSACSRIDLAVTEASTSFPSTSPWVTAVGGTQLRLTKNDSRKTEVVWNQPDPFAANTGVGGGGGLSNFFARPSYQNPAQTHVDAGTRSVPDIAAHAAIGPSIPFYTSTGQQAPGWTAGNGTSQATPLSAGAIALLSASERAAGRPPLGFVNPWLYKTQKKHKSAFFDVRIGTNQLYAGVGCCNAAKGYDMASGLGVPNYGTLLQYAKK